MDVAEMHDVIVGQKHWSPHLPTETYGIRRTGPKVGNAVQHYIDTEKYMREHKGHVTLLSHTLEFTNTDGLWGWTAEGVDGTKKRSHVVDGACWCGGPDGPRVAWAYDKAAGEWQRQSEE